MDTPNAFPRAATWSPDGQHVVPQQSGMSLRDYFAGQALVGLIANPDNIAKDKEHAAALCYAMADAMLSERERKS